MRFIAALAALLIQAQTLPPPFPRDGATRLLDNDRVVVWDVAWLPRAYPTYQHVYDYAGVYYTSGDRVIVSQAGSRRPTHTKAWDTFFIHRGVTHAEEAAGHVRFAWNHERRGRVRRGGSGLHIRAEIGFQVNAPAPGAPTVVTNVVNQAPLEPEGVAGKSCPAFGSRSSGHLFRALFMG